MTITRLCKFGEWQTKAISEQTISKLGTYRINTYVTGLHWLDEKTKH